MGKSLLDTVVKPVQFEAGRVLPTHVTREIAVLVDPQGPMAQGAQSIVSQIQHRHRDFGIRSFCFIGDQRKSGVTVLAVNVAAAFAAGGQRVALIETNFETPRIAAMTGLDGGRQGLSEWLVEPSTAGWANFLQPIYPNLLVMPAGNATKEGEVYLATRLRTLIIEMSRMFDVIICDAPPMGSVAAALAVVSAVERTIIVARANRTQVKTLFKFENLVKQCGGILGGTVYLDF